MGNQIPNILRIGGLWGLLCIAVGSSGCTITELQQELNAAKRRNQELRQDRDLLERNLSVAKGEQETLKGRLTQLTQEVQLLRAGAVGPGPEADENGLETPAGSAEEVAEAVPAVDPAERARPTGFEGISGLKATRDDRGGIRVVLEEGLFSAGMATPSKAGNATLDRVSAILKKNYSGHELSVEGHTDGTPVSKVKALYPSNWELSSARAAAVLRGLTARGAAGAGRSRVVGYGASRPIATNTTEEGRRQNRRVEIVIAGQGAG